MSAERIVEVAKLLDWLGIDAKRRGVEWWARCPFHAEKEPSWQIHDEPEANEHGLWRCYGCGARGNAGTLVRDLCGVTYRDACELIASHGLFANAAPIPIRVNVELLRPRVGFVLPTGVNFASFDKWVTPARRYAERRGITAEQVERWGVGYAVDGKLRGRIVFPIRDARRRLVGYTARSFTGDEPRYLEPKIADGYDPGAVFGEEHWPSPGERRILVVNEGAINALAVERALDAWCAERDYATPAVGALRGSHLDPGQLASLASFELVVVVSDPDAAGDKLWRSLYEQRGRQLTLRRATTPVGEDACDVERRDAPALAGLIAEAVWADECPGV